MESTLNLSQKYELRGYTVFFDIRDGLAAENLLDSLDRGTDIFKQVFNVDSEPSAKFYILNTIKDAEAVLGNNGCVINNPSVDSISDSIFIMKDEINEINIGRVGLRELGRMYFDRIMGETEIKMRHKRTPTWLKEGLILQAAFKYNRDNTDDLTYGWNLLLDANKKNQLVKPALLDNDLTPVSDENRRQLAIYQSFYMVHFLLNTYCDSFFSRYSTLMKVIDYMEAETCFRQITSFDFEKFFAMFESWVGKNKAWA